MTRQKQIATKMNGIIFFCFLTFFTFSCSEGSGGAGRGSVLAYLDDGPGFDSRRRLKFFISVLQQIFHTCFCNTHLRHRAFSSLNVL